MAERETEFKFLLSPEQFQRLTELLGKPLKDREFVNRYYTVSERVERRDWVLRTRTESDRTVLTLKIGREVSPGVFDSMEYSESVSGDEPADWEATEAIRVFRKEVSVSPIGLQGESSNRRLVYQAPIAVGKVWELDRCRLPDGTTFHELEIEVAFSAEAELAQFSETLKAWAQENGLALVKSEKTKYARFLEAVN